MKRKKNKNYCFTLNEYISKMLTDISYFNNLKYNEILRNAVLSRDTIPKFYSNIPEEFREDMYKRELKTKTFTVGFSKKEDNMFKTILNTYELSIGKLIRIIIMNNVSLLDLYEHTLTFYDGEGNVNKVLLEDMGHELLKYIV